MWASHIGLHLAATSFRKSHLVYFLCVLIVPCEYLDHSFTYSSNNYLLSSCHVLDIEDTKMDVTWLLSLTSSLPSEGVQICKQVAVIQSAKS